MNPVIFKNSVETRFNDLDSYGHVNASLYLDYVASSRLRFMKDNYHLNVEDVLAKGVAFYLRTTTINFERPVTGLCRVVIESKVVKIEGPSVNVHFTIRSEDEKILHSDGELDYVVVDAKTARPLNPPQWLSDLFFKLLPTEIKLD